MRDRPLASLALATFNHQCFVRRAVEAALAQDYRPLEIFISDDASTDRTVEIAAGIVHDYRGPHAVRLNRNAVNLGVGAHTELLGRAAQGEVVVLSAGDDIDQPDRVSRVMEAFAMGKSRVMAVASPVTLIDENENALGESAPMPPMQDISARSLIRTGFPVRGAGSAYAKRVFECFESMGAAVRSGEDLVLPLRAALLGEVKVLPTPVSYYRLHGGSLMGGSGAMAPSADAFRSGLRRYLGGIAAARAVQLRDFRAHVAATGRQVDPDGTLEALLEARARQDGASAARAAGDKGAALTMLRCLAAGEIGARNFVKLMAMTNAPSLWYRYIRMRRAAIDRSQAGGRR